MAAHLIGAGVVGTVLFNGVYLIEGVTRSGYNAVQQTVSALSLGDVGWVQQADFIVFGVCIGCFAVGLRSLMTPGRWRTVVPGLQLVVACSLVLIGIANQDPSGGYPVGVAAASTPSLHGVLHLVGTFVALNARVVWCFVVAVLFARDAQWRHWSGFAAATGVAMMVFLGAFGASMSGGPAGLFERLSLLAASLLTAAISARLLAAGRGLSASAVRRDGRLRTYAPSMTGEAGSGAE